MKTPSFRQGKPGFAATRLDNFMARLDGGLNFGVLDGKAVLGASVAPEERQAFINNMRLNAVFYRSMAERVEVFLEQFIKENPA